MIASINPATGETLASFDPHSAEDVELRLARAAKAAVTWRSRPIAERAAVVAAAARILEAEKSALAKLMTLEMGKTFASAVAEVEKCALGCRFYAAHGAAILIPEIVADDAEERGEVRFEPLGVVLAVMPWNFPFWQVVRFAAPALVAGNVGLLKHASNVPQCALAIEDIFRRAGAGDAFQALLIGSDAVGALIADPRVRAVTITGSEPAGRSVAANAGQQLKKTVLELGGSDPYIVCASADIARAARVAVTARTINNGQSCIAAKRFIVVDDVAEDFTRRFVNGLRALRVGDPMLPDTDVGPLATRAIRDDLHRQVLDTVAAGARLLLGGHPVGETGNYYAPSVLTDVRPGMRAYEEELFGPVATLFRVPDLDAAIALANDTTFGLAASVWSADPAETERAIASLEAGSVFVNAMVASDPRYPFGGVKRSGYGRELGSWGMLEFVNVKTVRLTRVTGREVRGVE
jgi:succinate-semialdehyde dehydrogenase / glutarate-semialdehyde dehydrogenase